MSVVIETSAGDLVLDLYTDERPNCSKNFLKLCKIKYYHHCLIHCIQKNYIAQTGDPTGTGRGGESIYSFLYGDQARYIEMERVPKIKHRKLGAISMINNGQDMHGSQFLLTLMANLDYLDGKHTVFGEVAKGFDVLEKLNETVCDRDGRPYQDIRIFHTVILFDPFEDLAALSVMNGRESPEPTDERLNSDRIRVDEDVDQLDGMSQEEIDAFMREREARTRAKLLEIIGDLPDADMKPPENVLFVCKLNPVTNDDDLELIFSRFGKINSCEVIRDKKTGDSLCYAFIEFDKQEDCESAYFKMDNVLIDDRRIHVDFSQSVAKVNWKGKGTGTGYFADDRNYRNGGGSGGGGSGRNNENNSNQRNKSSGDNVIYNKKSSKSDSRYDLVFDDNEIEQMDQSNRYGRQYEPVASSTADQRRHNHQRQQYQQNADSGNHERYDRRGDEQRRYDANSRDDRDRDRNRGGGGHSSHSRDRERERDHRENRSNNGDRSKDRDREKERDRDRDRHNHHHHKESSKSSSSHHRR